MDVSQKFSIAVEHTLRWEGGYVNDPVDPGGETNFGISKRAHPDVDIANLTKEKAKGIYQATYWEPSRASHIKSLTVAAKYFDLCVNMGNRQAAILLQRAASVTEDGIVGPITLSAVNDLHPSDMVFRLVYVASDFYQSLVNRRPAMQKYWTGWMNRLKDLV